MNFLKDFQTEIKTFFIVALVAIIVAVGGIFFLRGFSPAPISPMPLVVQQTSPPTPQSQALDTSIWQTYRNDELGFELKYPESWQAKQTTAQKVLIGNVDGDNSQQLLIERIDENEANVSLDEWINERTVEEAPQKINFGNTNGYRVDEGNFSHLYFMDKNRTVFVAFFQRNSSGDLTVLDQILSTFRFVDEKESLKIDSNVVWELVPALRDCTRVQAECVPSVMKQNNASEQAIEFFMQTGWFAVDFQDYGIVDLVTLGNPWRVNSNSDYMLANEQSSYIIIENEISGDLFEKVKDYHILSDAFPEYSIWGTDNWFIEQRDQSFLFGFDVKDERGCHACSSAYIAIIAFELDDQGNYLGPRLLEVRRQETDL